MKVIFFIVVLFHALIHLMGFIKAYQIAKIPQLTQTISHPAGILWLMTAVLFIVALVLKSLKKDWWWMIAAAAVVVSQSLIALSWNDAKFGTAANAIILLAIIIAIAEWNFNKQIHKEIELMLADAALSDSKVITEKMLEHLPSEVRMWLTNVGLVGSNFIHTVTLKQKGMMKLKPEQKNWSRASAEQYVTTDKPAFLWHTKMKMNPLLHVIGRDFFMNGRGTMIIKVASLIPVVKTDQNKKVNESSLARYLLELPWYPSMALSPAVTWESAGENKARATLTTNGISSTATFHFDDAGELLKVSSFRYKDSDEKAELVECIGEVRGTGVANGIRIPTKLDISWMLDKGKFTWYKFEIFDVKIK